MKHLKHQKEFDEKIALSGAVAVCSVLESDEAVSLARRLLSKNILAMEIAYRNLSEMEKTDECIRAVRREVPEILLGAATVVNREIAVRAVRAGAQFILSPGLNPSTVKFCIRKKIPVYPGVQTPTEIEAALELGLCTLKFFPAEHSGGTELLRCLSGPFPNVRFIVSGGLNAKNEASYRELKNVAAVSGSWLSADTSKT